MEFMSEYSFFVFELFHNYLTELFFIADNEVNPLIVPRPIVSTAEEGTKLLLTKTTLAFVL